MSILQAIVLGIVQGLTEFLPISSSGHLIVTRWLFGWTFSDVSIDKAFDASIHLGTLVAAAAYFWRDIGKLAGGFFRTLKKRKAEDLHERFAWYLIVASIPGAAFGLVGESFIEEKLGEPWLIAIMLILGGAVLYVADRFGKKVREFDEIRLRDSAISGVAQAIALSPGASRSGVTMTTNLFLGLEREAAARFSFLMLIPIAFGAGMYKLVKLLAKGFPPDLGLAFAVGIATSAVTGFIAIWGLLRFLKTRSFLPFVVYRIVVGVLILGAIGFGMLPATI